MEVSCPENHRGTLRGETQGENSSDQIVTQVGIHIVAFLESQTQRKEFLRVAAIHLECLHFTSHDSREKIHDIRVIINQETEDSATRMTRALRDLAEFAAHHTIRLYANAALLLIIVYSHVIADSATYALRHEFEIKHAVITVLRPLYLWI